MLNVGFDSYINDEEIVAIVPYAGQRLKDEISVRKKENGSNKSLLLDCTRKKPLNSVVVCKNGLYILSTVSSKTLVGRLNKSKYEGGKSFYDKK